ncbi:MAG: hypothetical protein RL198_135 [Actinomycetota bacterium]
MRAVASNNFAIAATTSILALMLTFSSGSSAQAHESIVDQYPGSNQTVAAGITTIRLDFSGDLLVLSDASGIELQITAPDGTATPLAERGCLVIGPRSIESTVELDAGGEYQVDWQVTAGDGHPLSDSFRFRVDNSDNYVANQALGDIRCEGNKLPDGSIAAPPNDSHRTGFSTNTWLAILLGLALTLVAALTYLLLTPGSRRAKSN